MVVNRFGDPSFLDGSFESRSFVDVLAGSSSNVCFPELKPSSFCGLPSLWILEEEILGLAAPIQYALVGFFPSRRPSLDSIHKFIFNLKMIAKFSVTLLDPSLVVVKSYFVNNCFVKLTKWFPSLDMSFESPVIPICISFSNLRPQLFSPRIFHALGSLFVDNATSVGSQPSLACVLVELDITKKYTDKVWLGPKNLGYIQMIEMENFS
ncbi:hypothetical protein IEQ34_004549 [Dendrobium chrysotoxum]|uniref:DUF4283 domain-containing protein n=1 Tax=Dendrobium chrysotoxum TaxID=161865 RepID=A0AAV7HE81_DENCH|nr:hypothetical protein IEQ34_004549 [Dendrobium chrysotoxum]